MGRQIKALKKNLWWLAAVFCMLLAVNAWLDVCYYRDYEEKMDIIMQLLDAPADGRLDAAAALLKDRAGNGKKAADGTNAGHTSISGQQFISQYGYDDNKTNRYYVQLVRRCVQTAAVSWLLYFLLVFLILFQKKRMQTEWESYLEKIRQKLLCFREGKEDVLDNLPVMEESRDAAKALGEQLTGLWAYVQLIRTQAHDEKQETKSLVTDLSHQLKTPVAALDTCLAVLEAGTLSNSERTEFTARCRDELEGLKELLASLLSISRMEAGMIALEFVEAPLRDTLVNAVSRIYPRADEKQIELSVDAMDGDVFVLQDKRWLCEAFINLLDNAVKYSPAGSGVHIRMQRRSSFVRIEIADAGIGIPKKECHKIFQRFYRGSDKRVRAQSGSGVGLYLTRKIIGEHLGTVSVKCGYKEDMENPGCTFVVQLPFLTKL